MNDADDLTAAVLALALEAGFARAAIAQAGPVDRADRLKAWLADGWNGRLAYMARNLPERMHPARLLPGAQSVICLCVSYAPAGPEDVSAPVAAFARGRDYHKVLKKRCGDLMDRIRRIAPEFLGRAFVDSAPIMERSLAAAAGLGWIGRNGCLVVPGLGSYVLLCEIVCNLPLRLGSPQPSQCHNCRACLAACPTRALIGEKLVDARACVSGLTVERHGPIDGALRAKMGRRVFGCDACQQACPHNRGVPPGDPELLKPAFGPGRIGRILGWSEADWSAATRGSAVRRAGFAALMRNAVIAAGNSADPALTGPLEDLRRRCPQLAEVVDWAVGRLK